MAESMVIAPSSSTLNPNNIQVHIEEAHSFAAASEIHRVQG